MIFNVCSSPWCKATFEVHPHEVVKSESGDEIYPSKCMGCRGNDKFVTWEDKSYEGDRWDGTPHEFMYKIRKYY
jgi:hypothetical protein